MNKPGPMRDREVDLVHWGVKVGLDGASEAVLDEVHRLIEDICLCPWWKPFRKRRLRRDVDLSYRLASAFERHVVAESDMT